MHEKLALSFSVATFVAAVGVILFMRGMSDRLHSVEQTVNELSASRPAGRPPGSVGRAKPPRAGDPELGATEALSTDAARKKLDHIIEKLQVLEDDGYESYTDMSQDLMQLKREITRIGNMLRRVVRGLGTTIPGLGSLLPTAGAELDFAARTRLKEEAAKFGVIAEDGVVTVTGFLNMAPDKRYPIEYFIARYPESSHETLVHIVGNKTPEEVNENPYGALSGLPTAVYLGLLAAGFHQGKPAHPAPGSDPRAEGGPKWVLPTGDTVYLSVRWTQDGEDHVARATDWVIDPSTDEPLPPDALKFTGSLRKEDYETGEEIVMAEESGLVVTVWPNAGALISVALESAFKNNYQYNAERIPKTGEQTTLELVFSKEPLELKGKGIPK